MGKVVFDNEELENWLSKKSQEILERSHLGVSSEDLMVLCLKGMTNHFHHLDVDLRKEISSLDKKLNDRIDKLEMKMDEKFKSVETMIRWQIAIVLILFVPLFTQAFIK